MSDDEEQVRILSLAADPKQTRPQSQDGELVQEDFNRVHARSSAGVDRTGRTSLLMQAERRRTSQPPWRRPSASGAAERSRA
jgi:hypothetical protein